jgi:hypothetical protein
MKPVIVRGVSVHFAGSVQLRLTPELPSYDQRSTNSPVSLVPPVKSGPAVFYNFLVQKAPKIQIPFTW